MNDDQSTQPLTDAELANIASRAEATEDPSVENSYGAFADSASDVPLLLAEVNRLRAANAAVRRDLFEIASANGAKIKRLQSALTAISRNEQAAGNRSLELQGENERLRLEAAQMESGAQIAMNAGVTALQEVERLEIVRDDLKLINDRMAEDRLRLVDERDSILADLLQYSQLHWEDCPLDEEDCYLCEGYERIRANAAERRHGKAPNQ